ncbi:uncharacterized protein [Chlorocebus sabaeus]|uniref:uncharacterized protein n=1 Tax=Chlorocebus sabaeus TaxID=60711 RepID=UPI003BF99D4F
MQTSNRDSSQRFSSLFNSIIRTKMKGAQARRGGQCDVPASSWPEQSLAWYQAPQVGASKLICLGETLFPLWKRKCILSLQAFWLGWVNGLFPVNIHSHSGRVLEAPTQLRALWLPTRSPSLWVTHCEEFKDRLRAHSAERNPCRGCPRPCSQEPGSLSRDSIWGWDLAWQLFPAPCPLHRCTASVGRARDPRAPLPGRTLSGCRTRADPWSSVPTRNERLCPALQPLGSTFQLCLGAPGLQVLPVEDQPRTEAHVQSEVQTRTNATHLKKWTFLAQKDSTSPPVFSPKFLTGKSCQTSRGTD